MTSHSTRVFPKHLRHSRAHAADAAWEDIATCPPLGIEPPFELCLPQTSSLCGSQRDCLQRPFLPVEALLVAQECSLLEHLRVSFSHCLPRPSDPASLEAASKALFPFRSRVVWLLLPPILASHIHLGSLWVLAL